ncbi:hypothetical protein FM042_05905 [Aliidiomarina halalkaliphila]|uniref:Uncharacterized protein n=1 Tax=Aliidiomarina halalkaliphila TaxID=2593535 RepID=A0A552X713_9GAMM|nr:hypothetical protein [Aliidiomarina halalkaliphila]TRW50363.1 hypothetical protein FM042_05905 [Aliidiomarina halalkaliphila]
MKKILLIIAFLIVVALAYFSLMPESGTERVASHEALQEREARQALSRQTADDIVGDSPERTVDGTSLGSQATATDDDDYTNRGLVDEYAGHEHSENLQVYLTSKDGTLVLDTSRIYKLSVIELAEHIHRLDGEGVKDALSYDAERRLDTLVRDASHVQHQALQCSQALCGVLFSAYDAADVSTLLDNVSRDRDVQGLSRGGVLRTIEDNGSHYGLLILVLDRGEPLKLN